MEQNYIFIDGSALLSQIRRLQKNDTKFEWRRLDPIKFIKKIQISFPELGSASYKRAVFYFPIGEPDLGALLLMPDPKTPGLLRDVHFKHCGKKLKKASSYESWLETVPMQWKDYCTKSEKGVDVEICCDALRLASFSNIDRLFLLTNDSDFLPLLKTLKDLGVNVSLIHLSKTTNPNSVLLRECDTYDLLPENYLEQVFEVQSVDKLETGPIEEILLPEKSSGQEEQNIAPSSIES